MSKVTYTSNSQEFKFGTGEEEWYSAIALRFMLYFFKASTKACRCRCLGARCVGHGQRTGALKDTKKAAGLGTRPVHTAELECICSYLWYVIRVVVCRTLSFPDGKHREKWTSDREQSCARSSCKTCSATRAAR